MTKRHPIELDTLGLDDIAKRLATSAPEIALGWTLLRDDMQLAGWPARSDNDTRSRVRVVARCQQCREPFTTSDGPAFHTEATGHTQYVFSEPDGSIDYADPTGEQAGRLASLHNDRQALEDHRRLIEQSLHAMIAISARHRQLAPAAPMCTHTGCDDTVERTKSGGYVLCQLVAGVWVCERGARPTCARHRHRTRRGAA